MQVRRRARGPRRTRAGRWALPLHAHLLLELGDLDAPVLLDHECRDASMAGASGRSWRTPCRCPRCPALVIHTFVAGEDVRVAVADRPRRHRRDVAARVGLGQAVRTLRLSACDAREVLASSAPRSPKLMTGSIDSFEISSIRLVDAHTRASSSAAIACVTRSAPAPPYSTGRPQRGQLHRHQRVKCVPVVLGRGGRSPRPEERSCPR